MVIRIQKKIKLWCVWDLNHFLLACGIKSVRLTSYLVLYNPLCISCMWWCLWERKFCYRYTGNNCHIDLVNSVASSSLSLCSFLFLPVPSYISFPPLFSYLPFPLFLLFSIDWKACFWEGSNSYSSRGEPWTPAASITPEPVERQAPEGEGDPGEESESNKLEKADSLLLEICTAIVMPCKVFNILFDQQSLCYAYILPLYHWNSCEGIVHFQG